MNILLLTHVKEMNRKTNTGALVVETLENRAKVILWERTRPDSELLKCIERGNVALLYPTDESIPLTVSCHFDSYIVIDSTWQEAQKIYNKSPYLKSLPTVKIETDQKSLYSLRRNQKADGLCTAEIVIEVLKNEDFLDLAEALETKLKNFISKG